MYGINCSQVLVRGAIFVMIFCSDMSSRGVYIYMRRFFKSSLTTNHFRNHMISSPLENKVYQELSTLIPIDKSKILLSISGGSDSMAMLHLFARIRQNFCTTLSLEIVNFNHKMRLEADEEALFVGHWAKFYNIEYYSVQMPDNRLSEESNFQNNARNWRREESLKIIQSNYNESSTHRFIATAHNSEDQTETILLKLLRGAHISHLQGMLPVDGFFLKPLLSHGKEELRQYLISNNFTWREDSSNNNRKYKRNKVRLDVIPLLHDIAGGQEALQDRLLALEEQSKHVQLMVAADCEEARRVLCFRRFPGSSAPFSLEFGPSFASHSPLVISEILRSWIEKEVQLRALPYRSLMSMTELVTQPIRFGQRSRAVTISEEWDLQRLGSELRLIRRSQEDIDRHTIPQSESTFYLMGSTTRQEWTVSVSHPDHISITVKASNHSSTERITIDSDAAAASSSTELVFFFSLIAPPSQQQQPLSYTLRYVNLAEDVFVSSNSITTNTTNNNNNNSNIGNDIENKNPLQKEKKVRDILVDRKVPLHRRDRVLVLCADDTGQQSNKVIAILVSNIQIFIADGFNPHTRGDDLEIRKIIELSIRASC